MEVWKPIKGYEESYEVSDLGNIRSLNYGTWKQRHFVKVGQYSLDGLNTYNSEIDAAKDGFNSSCISNCINNRLNSYKGYLWRYI